MPRRRLSADDDGLTELGRRWRVVAIAHEALVHRYMLDVVRYRLLLGQDLELGALPSAGLPEAQDAAAGRPGSEAL
jgi:hypothetical protein